ncbi:MAG: transposase [Pseudomonadota bacterium]
MGLLNPYCLDEFSKQLIKEKRIPIPASSGRARREDSEYIREGSATAFLTYAPLEGTREVHVSEDGRRTACDYADVIEHLVDEMFPEAEKIILVEDNLNTHKDASLYEAFSPEKARRLASKLERHYTPKHGSWLNIAEIEISALSRTTLPDRVESLDEFRRLCEQGAHRRNDEHITTNWRFTAENARTKLKRLYPSFEY